MGDTTLVTGGSGYIGALLAQELHEAGRDVRVLDSLLHGQEDIAAEQEEAGGEVIRADVRDADARRRALTGAEAVVHLAAIVGDPPCALDPKASDDVNVQATRALVSDANELGVGATRVRLHVLELRTRGRSRRADNRGGRAAPRIACAPYRRMPR